MQGKGFGFSCMNLLERVSVMGHVAQGSVASDSLASVCVV